MKLRLLTLIFTTMFFSCNFGEVSDVPTMDEMCMRLFPQHASSFSFHILKDSVDTDRFIVETNGNKIVISGNNCNSLAVGLNYYLKEYCHTHVSWYADDSIYMPKELPLPKEKISVLSNCKNRFFLNYCTYGYTMPYWKWSDWERLIDWMALNGINMPLAITGQESIWYNVWTSMGMSDEQVRSYFTGPAHLPWHRMANVDYWQSPLPKSWLNKQAELQKTILKRERELGMKPVLPAFSGHVPGELQKIFPQAKISTMSKWGGFDDKYRSHFLDPMDSLFTVIQHKYLEEQTKIYGTDHIYGIDPFNEVDSPNWNEDFLANVSNKIYQSIHDIDSSAQWLQMTWMFYYDKEKWTQPRIKAFLDAVPKNKLILLDYFCDNTEIWRQTDKYYGQPYIWCYLGNFGGNTMISGDINDVDMKIERLFKEGGNNVYGLGATLEGFDSNPIMYEYVFSKAWDIKKTSTDKMKTWAMSRGGVNDSIIVKAWLDMYNKIYIKTASCGQAVLINARPRLEGTKSWNTYPTIPYNNADLWAIWKDLLSAKDVDNDHYKWDVVNIGRQTLGNIFPAYREKFTECYNAHDIEGMKLWAGRMNELIEDVNNLLSCNINFSMGKWVNDAIDFGDSEEEKSYYYQNAQCIVTIWGQTATQLNDYANRGWAGLTDSFYGERWKRFTQGAIDAVTNGKQFNEDQFTDEITKFEYEWTLQKHNFVVVSGQSPVEIGRKLMKKYESINVF